MINKPKSKGIALFITLTLLLLLSIVTIAVLLNSYNYVSISERQIRRLKALSLAESGIHYAYWKIRVGENDEGEAMNFDDEADDELHPSEGIPEDIDIEVVVSAPDQGQNNRRTIRSTVIY